MRRKVVVAVVYSTLFLFVFDRCAYNDINPGVDCSLSDLALSVSSTQNATSCKAIDGVIAVTATGGIEPYNFKINDGEYQTNSTFGSLPAGTYTIRVKDFNNCWKEINATIGADGSTLTATFATTQDNQCTSDNGTITVTASGGRGPYQYQLDSRGFGTSNTFSAVSSGIHHILIKDAEECQTNLSISVPRGSTGISFASSIKPIMDANCNLSGCHGAGAGSRDWTIFNNVKANAQDIKTRTSNKSMPPGAPLPQAEIDQIACWVDDGAPNN